MSAARVLDYVWATSPEMLNKATPKDKGVAEPVETLAFYRKHTERLLRQYMHTSMEMGRVPSILGKCMFRGKVSSYRIHSFEDAVIFVFDIEKCLKLLDGYSQDLVGRIALQEYTQMETASLMGQPLRSIVRKYAEAIDALTAIFLQYELLTIDRGDRSDVRRNRKCEETRENPNYKKSCQGGISR
jgi:hypothetical protein